MTMRYVGKYVGGAIKVIRYIGEGIALEIFAGLRILSDLADPERLEEDYGGEHLVSSSPSHSPRESKLPKMAE